MGIKSLNRYFMDKCSKQSIRKTQLREFAGKTLVIDTSIYLYKFAADDAIMENMFQMISIFKKYNIEPIFVFDGKPPSEKKGVLMQRRLDKREAQQKYNALKYSLDEGSEDEAKRKRLLADMEALKKQFIRIKESDVIKVKRLMDNYGVIYYDANGEADVLCCYLVKTGRAWACVSDDMDMFVYGCCRVIRHLSMLNHTAIIYDTERILREINMTEDVFRDIMVLSGTDYNINNNTNLVETLKWFYEYNNSKSSLQFYEWLFRYTKYVNDKDCLINIRNMFVIDSYEYHLIMPPEKKTNIDQLKNILSEDGFIFVN
jgi:flap endonuclease-1